DVRRVTLQIGCAKKGNLVGSATLDLPSSPSSCDGFTSYLHKNDNCSGIGNSDATPSGRKIRITLLS
ncbi:hypothetical protein Q8G46_28055, partial [Klebsiella pneumoniae]|uniref:hypothetical protein n=1 Tax=Klebsiella pneumoniae TaxID=573 RepID=UPI003013515B